MPKLTSQQQDAIDILIGKDGKTVAERQKKRAELGKKIEIKEDYDGKHWDYIALCVMEFDFDGILKSSDQANIKKYLTELKAILVAKEASFNLEDINKIIKFLQLIIEFAREEILIGLNLGIVYFYNSGTGGKQITPEEKNEIRKLLQHYRFLQTKLSGDVKEWREIYSEAYRDDKECKETREKVVVFCRDIYREAGSLDRRLQFQKLYLRFLVRNLELGLEEKFEWEDFEKDFPKKVDSDEKNDDESENYKRDIKAICYLRKIKKDGMDEKECAEYQRFFFPPQEGWQPRIKDVINQARFLLQQNQAYKAYGLLESIRDKVKPYDEGFDYYVETLLTMAEQDFPPAQVELCQLYLVHPLPLHLNSRALKQVLEYVPFKKDKVSSKFSAEQSYFVGMAIQLKEFGKRPNIPLAKEYLTTSFAVNYAWAGLAKVKLFLADAVPNFEDIMELVNKVYLFAKRNNDWVLRNACIDLLEPWASSHDAVEQFVVHGKRERAAEFQYQKGLRLLKVEKFDEAKECFVRAVSDDKEHAQAQTELATVGSKKAEANYQKGLAYIKDEKYEAAVPFFQVAIDNGHIDAHLPMGNIYASWKKPTDSKLAEHYFSSYKDKKIAKLLQKADKQSLQETVALFEKGFLENRDGARISLLPLERSGLLDHVYSQSCKGNAVALSLFRDLEREKMKLDIDFKEDKLIFSYRERNRRYPSEERNDYNFELIEALGEIKKYTARLLNPKDNTERRSALDKLAAMKLEMSDEIEAMHPIVFYARALKCDDVSGKRELFAQALRHHAKPYFLEWPLLGEVITYLRQPAPSAPALEGVPNLPKQGLEGEADQIVQSLRYQH